MNTQITDSIQAVAAKLRSTSAAFILCITALYFLLSLGFNGPAYLQDEIGYLAKAAFFSGKSIDAASSYHAGYSVLLAPLFLITTDISKIWTGIAALNAALWTGSLFMLYRLIPLLHPSAQPREILAGIAGVATYPVWATLTGYAFPSPLVVSISLLSLLLLNWLIEGGWRSPTALSVCAGLIFWAHPTGLAIITALAITIAITAPRANRFKILLKYLFITGVLVIAYKAMIHSWINQAMTPAGFQPISHYKTYTEVLEKLTDPAVIGRSALRLMGELSYLIISTLGVFVVGAWSLLKSLKNGLASTQAALSFCSLAMLMGIALMAALQLETFELANDIQHWQYGRYIDAALPPILAIGFVQISQEQKNPHFLLGAAATIAFLLITGMALDRWAHAVPNNNIFTTPGFWPQYIIKESSFLKWYLLGSAGCAVAFLATKITLPLTWCLAATISLLAQNNWHHQILQSYSYPTKLPEFINTNYPAGTCVGFARPENQSPLTFQNERLNLYSIHLASMDFKRMHPKQWMKECSGPYLTLHPELFNDIQNAIPLMKETDSGLYLFEKLEQLNTKPYEFPESSGSLIVNSSRDKDYLARTVLYRDSKDLGRHTQVGVTSGTGLASTGKAGFLFFGPYLDIPAGDYRLEIHLTAIKTSTAILDAVGARADRKFLETPICTEGCTVDRPVSLDVKIPNDESNLEIRMRVKQTDSVLVRSIKLTRLSSGTP